MARALKFDPVEGLISEMAESDDLAPLGGASFSSTVQMLSGAELLGLPPTPSSDDAAASRAYVDNLIEGLSLVAACRVRTDGELDASWAASGSGVGKTLTSPDSALARNDIDGVTLGLGDRVLVADYDGDAASSDNGIYAVTQLADGAAAALVLTRATDFDGSPSAEVADGKTTWVGQGTTYADTRWSVISDDAIVVDTDGIEFAQSGASSSLIGGAGISIAAGTASIALASNPGLEFDAAGDAGALRALVDPAGGVLRGAAGLAVNPDGVTLQVNGSNQLEALFPDPYSATAYYVQDGVADDLEVYLTRSLSGDLEFKDETIPSSVTLYGILAQAYYLFDEENGSPMRLADGTPLLIF